MKLAMFFAWKGGFFESRDETARLLRAWRRDKRMTVRRLAPYHYRVEGADGRVSIDRLPLLTTAQAQRVIEVAHG